MRVQAIRLLKAHRSVQACEEAPPAKRQPLYSMWADFEEKHGLARHCFAVFDKAVAAVPKDERAAVYRLYAAKAKALVGIPKVCFLGSNGGSSEAHGVTSKANDNAGVTFCALHDPDLPLICSFGLHAFGGFCSALVSCSSASCSALFAQGS